MSGNTNHTASRHNVADFWIQVDTPDGEDGCWIWAGSKYRNGYGQGRCDGMHAPAHRIAYILTHGADSVTGLDLDHLCRNRACVNPDHLEPVTHLENVQRGTGAEAQRARHAAVTHCPQGHEYTPENTYVAKSTRRGCHNRLCRACLAAAARRRRARG